VIDSSGCGSYDRPPSSLPRVGKLPEVLNWKNHYELALMRGKHWIEGVHSGDNVFAGSACGEPRQLTGEFSAVIARGGLDDITVYQMPWPGGSSILASAGTRLRFVGLTYHPSLASLMASGAASFMPTSIFQISREMAEGALSFDVALVQVSPPDERGWLSFGVSVDFAAQAVRKARYVVAEISQQCPRSLGDAGLHISDVDAAIVTTGGPAEWIAASADDEARRIADNLLPYVPNRSTIEIGMGSVMTAVLESLRGRRDIGLHTGLLTEPMMDLVESGVITNAYKGIDRGVSVANQCRGTRRLYDFVDRNQNVALRPARYTHDHRILARLKTFRAINSAVQVDLIGQVNSEFVDGRRVSSNGGLTDFVRACQEGEDARSIIALRSTTSKGTSRIVADLSGTPTVTLTADLADVIVTEYGAAELRSLDARRRADALIAIAHPAHRESLRGHLTL
jgi:acyl-CoA hydrolase